MATSEGIPSSIDIEFLELNDNPYLKKGIARRFDPTSKEKSFISGYGLISCSFLIAQSSSVIRESGFSKRKT